MKKGYLIDLDGTIFRGSQPCPGAKEWIRYLHDNGIPFAFFTNNSSRTQRQAREHMEHLGFEYIKDEHFFTSAMAAARYIAKHYPQRKAFVVGESGLVEALIESGFEVVEQDADFVFVGMNRQGNYDLYSRALREIVKGATFVGTNNDRQIPLEGGPNIGNGSVVALLEYASGQESVKIGKPHMPMVETALDYLKLEKEQCIIVGDNLETDILCGLRAGIETIMVLGGVHDQSDCERLKIYPSRIVSSLFELMEK